MMMMVMEILRILGVIWMYVLSYYRLQSTTKQDEDFLSKALCNDQRKEAFINI